MPWTPGLTYGQAFQQGFNPVDAYDGQEPVLAAVSGTPQTGAPGGFVPEPLVAQVTNAAGLSVANALVTFSIDAGQLQRSSSGAPAPTLAVTTDADGQATVFASLPNSVGTTSTITAAATNSRTHQTAQTTFTLHTDDGTGEFDSPFDVALQSTFNDDASSTLTWSHRLDGVTGYTVSRSNNGGSSWTLLGTASADATSFRVSASEQGVIGYSQFKVQPLTGTAGRGGTTAANGSGSGPAAGVTRNMPPPRYAVIDLGLTEEVGHPKQINNMGTVLLATNAGAISRWRKGNFESLYTFPNGFDASRPWDLRYVGWPYVAFDELDNVAIFTYTIGVGLDPLVIYPPTGNSFSLKSNPPFPPEAAFNTVFSMDNGRFYGSCRWLFHNPIGDYDNFAEIYNDGARWDDPNASPVEYGSVSWIINEAGQPDLSGIVATPWSVRNGVELLSKGSYYSLYELGYFLGGVSTGDLQPILQNSKGVLLAGSSYDADSTVTCLKSEDGEIQVVADAPLLADDVWGFNAARITVTNSQGITQEIDAPQLVGTDSVYGHTPFVYEKNPISQTYVEVANNALLGDTSLDSVSKGGPSTSGAEHNASNLDVDRRWNISHATAINNKGVIAAIGNDDAGGKHSLLLPLVTLDSDKADTTKVFLNADGTPWKIPPNTNPAYFRKQNPPDPTLSQSNEPALVIFYNDVIDNSFVVQPFTVNLRFSDVQGATWTKTYGPASGMSLNSDQPNARFVNPKVGGLYQFDGTLGTANVRASLIMPLAGAEINDVVTSDLMKADTFATKVVTNYGFLKRNFPITGRRWFVISGAGDYLGRPDNVGSKTCVRFNPVSDLEGTGAVATWFGVPVRLSKASNFLVGYATQKIGVTDATAWLSQVIGTTNDASATASFYFGRDVASGQKNYSDDTADILRASFYDSDLKHIRLWPNNAAADNHVADIPDDYNVQFCSPGFTRMTNP